FTRVNASPNCNMKISMICSTFFTTPDEIYKSFLRVLHLRSDGPIIGTLAYFVVQGGQLEQKKYLRTVRAPHFAGEGYRSFSRGCYAATSGAGKLACTAGIVKRQLGQIFGCGRAA